MFSPLMHCCVSASRPPLPSVTFSALYFGFAWVSEAGVSTEREMAWHVAHLWFVVVTGLFTRSGRTLFGHAKDCAYSKRSGAVRNRSFRSRAPLSHLFLSSFISVLDTPPRAGTCRPRFYLFDRIFFLKIPYLCAMTTQNPITVCYFKDILVHTTLRGGEMALMPN